MYNKNCQEGKSSEEIREPPLYSGFAACRKRFEPGSESDAQLPIDQTVFSDRLHRHFIRLGHPVRDHGLGPEFIGAIPDPIPG